jgi:hypothetical protein
LNFLKKFSKKIQILNFMKIGPLGAELFHTDGGTGRLGEPNSQFSQFFERSQKLTVLPLPEAMGNNTKYGGST